MRNLIISEKSDAAARISVILSSGDMKRKRLNNVQVFEFHHDEDDFNVVGLRGHVIELDYAPEYNDWNKVNPKDLVYAEPQKRITADNIIGTLRDLAKDSDRIIIATDFDREGELIGLETVRLLDFDMRGVKRAKFSAFTKVEIEKAFNELTDPDHRLAESAECRQVIDLAWGAALTRFISLASGQTGTNFLSVGRVQSPTLSLVVDRDREIRTFVPKPYWNVTAQLSTESDFMGTHQKNPFWDEAEAKVVNDKVSNVSKGVVASYERKEKDEYPIPPFNTTMFLAEANKMGISPSLAMKIAEDLYTSGYISYPRTDNTVYPRSLGLKYILEKFKESDFKAEAEELLAQPQIRPSRGRVETTDHPPIYPTEVATKKMLKGGKWEIYELIVRRFFATVAPPAKSESREGVVKVADEPFDVKGYRILLPGWRKYYPYIRVNEIIVPELKVGQEVTVKAASMERKETRPPVRYSQGTLLQEMERLALGTKSTRHEIIQKLYDRKYVVGNDLVPTQGGVAVVESLEKHAKTITESKMTAHLEQDMDDIANGKSTLTEIVAESQDMLSDVMEAMERHKKEIGDEIRSALAEQHNLGICPDCGGDLRIIRTKRGSEFIGCMNYPNCERTFRKPSGALVQPTQEKCETCGLPKIKVIRKGNPLQVVCIDPDCESNKGLDVVGVCPECGKELKVLFSWAGKRFIGCSGYPECKRTYPLPQFGMVYPVGETCVLCKAPMFGMKGKGGWKFCPNMDCPSNEKLKAEREAKKAVEGKTGKAPAKKAAVKKPATKKAVKKEEGEVPSEKKAAPKKTASKKPAAKKAPAKKTAAKKE
ncbi:MAG: Reverse gyrase [Methanomassiliicoccales archaeon PtaU1.Bin124]|nr:MAG: Reverse gyrase [Methanomassiliicoccales archaeon PtaU1.Bin124]